MFKEIAWIVCHFVAAGTNFGMMVANVPAVFLGDRMPIRLVHTIAAAIFATLGVAALLGADKRLGFDSIRKREAPCILTTCLNGHTTTFLTRATARQNGARA